MLKFQDLIEPTTRIGREIRMLERFYLEGAAYQYKQIQRQDKPDWDLASIAAPNGALLFALDLDYEADPTLRVCQFGPPRPARFEFDLPAHLWQPDDVFRIDADGIYEVRYESIAGGVRIHDQVSKVAVYVATKAPGLREQLEAQRRVLVQFEASFQFDPAGRDADFESLASFLTTD